MSSTSYLPEVEASAYPNVRISLRPVVDMVRFTERAGQGCFLCFETRTHGQHAVLVPCLRPTEPRRLRSRVVSRTDEKKETYHYYPITPRERACESDSDIYQRLVDTCYQYLGWWIKWLPYYGVIDVLEVNFQFAGVKERDGRYIVRMKPVNLEEVAEKCERLIARHPVYGAFVSDDACFGNYHSSTCRNDMDEWGQECIKDEAEKAERRQNRLHFLSQLKHCAQEPASANGLRTLEGMAQESCFYNIQFKKDSDQPKWLYPDGNFQETAWMRGLQFIVGWQIDRMSTRLPIRLSFASFGVVLIWLCVAIWRGGLGDWNTAFAFAQVIAASVAIVITSTRV